MRGKHHLPPVHATPKGKRMEDAGRLNLIADVALPMGGWVVLVKNPDVRTFDGRTEWFLPEDCFPRLEHPEDAVKRIRKEQVGLAAMSLRLGFVESFEGNGTRALIFHYEGHVKGPERSSPGANTAHAEWFGLAGLPDRSELGHEGWAIDGLDASRRRAKDR